MPTACNDWAMANKYTVTFERDGDWFIASCPEVPGANGQGKTKDEARANVVDAIRLINEDHARDFWSKTDAANIVDWSSAKRVILPYLKRSTNDA